MGTEWEGERMAGHKHKQAQAEIMDCRCTGNHRAEQLSDYFLNSL